MSALLAHTAGEGDRVLETILLSIGMGVVFTLVFQFILWRRGGFSPRGDPWTCLTRVVRSRSWLTSALLIVAACGSGSARDDESGPTVGEPGSTEAIAPDAPAEAEPVAVVRTATTESTTTTGPTTTTEPSTLKVLRLDYPSDAFLGDVQVQDDNVWLSRGYLEAGAVDMIDPATGATRASVAVGRAPYVLVALSGGVAVVNVDDRFSRDDRADTVMRIDAATQAVTATTPMAVFGDATSDGSTTWVGSTTSGDRVVAIDAAGTMVGDTGPLSDTFAVAFPIHVGYGAGSLWVSNLEPDPAEANPHALLRRFDPNTLEVLERFDVPASGRLGVTSTDVWVVDESRGGLYRVDPVTGESTQIAVAAGAADLAIVGEHVWVSIPETGTVLELDGDGTVTQSITIDGEPSRISAGGRYVWAIDRFNNDLYRLATDGHGSDTVVVTVGSEVREDPVASTTTLAATDTIDLSETGCETAPGGCNWTGMLCPDGGVDVLRAADRWCPAVVQAQTWLNKWGYPVDVDGLFGPGTEAAVRAFQMDNGLEVDGLIGPTSWTLLSEADVWDF